MAQDAGIGALGVKLSVDTAEFSAGLDRAAQISQREMARIERANKAAAKEVERLAAVVQRQVDTFGLSGTALLRYDAQIKGATDRVGPLIDKLEQMKRAAAGAAANDTQFTKVSQAVEKYGISAGQAGAALRSLPAQMTDVVTQLQGGANPLTILLQQGGQIKDQFGGIGPAVSALATFITPVSVAVTLLAAAGAGLAYVFSSAASEASKLQQSLVLTGNFAGTTQGQFDAMARSVADNAKTTTGAAREAIQGLISTGDVGPRLLKPMAEAVALTVRVTGEAADKTVADFAKMADGVAKWAADHNRSLNFINAATYERIRALEEEGKTEEAQAVVIAAYTQRMQAAAAQTSYWSDRIGFLRRDLDSLGEAIRRAFSGASLDGLMAGLDTKIAARNRLLSVPFPGGVVGQAAGTDQLQRDRNAAAAADESASVAAVMNANAAATQKAGIAASDYLKKLHDQAKGADAVADKLKEYRRQVAAAAAAGNPVSAAQQAADEAQLSKKFAGPKGPKAPRDDDTKTLRDNALRDQERDIAAERDLAQQRQRFLDLYNTQGLLSIQSYYDARRAITDAATTAQVAAYDRELAALRDYQGKAKKATERAEAAGKIAEITDKRDKALRDAGTAGIELAVQQSAAEDALRRSVAGVNAEVLQLQGNLSAAAAMRFDAANAGLRKSLDANGQTGALEQLDALRGLTIAQAAYSQQQTEAQRITEGLRLAEERIALTEKLGATTTIQAAQQTTAARQAAVAQMAAVVEAEEAIARAAGNPALVQQAERSRLALEQLRASADVVGDRMKATFESAFSGAFADFISGTKTAGDAFKAFADSVIRELSRMAAQQAAAGIAKSFGDYLKGSRSSSSFSGSPDGGYSPPDSTGGYARGGVFDRSGEVHAFAAGGIVNRTTPFRFAAGGTVARGIMGEAGPEAIMPLARGPNGKLGVVAAGAKGGDVYVTVENHGGAQIETREERRSDGSREIRLIVQAAKAEMARDVRSGGEFASALQGTYGLNRGAGVMRGA